MGGVLKGAPTTSTNHILYLTLCNALASIKTLKQL